MFERYTERARRTIFFARYEASTFGSPWIETEHLLLGLLREDKDIAAKLPGEAIRAEIEQRTPRQKSISTTVDLPLSHPAKRALCYAAEEADDLGHKHIDSGHLLLGLLRVETCVAAELLMRHGFRYPGARELVSRSYAGARWDAPRATPPFTPTPAPETVTAPSLQDLIKRFHSLMTNAAQHLYHFSEADCYKPLAKRTWSRKQALGHLVDWATTHHQWFARALSEPKLSAAGYPEDAWVPAQAYQDIDWHELADLWIALNNFLLHVLAGIPENKLSTACRIGIADPMPLSRLISGYVDHVEDILGQILTYG